LDALYAMGARQGHPYFARMEVFLSRTQNLRQVNDLTDKAKFPELKNYEVQDDGGFAYAPGLSKADRATTDQGKKLARSYASITAAGLKCLLQLGAKKDDPRVKAALGWLASHYTLEHNAGLDVPGEPAKGQQGIYYFYWTFSKAMALAGDSALKLPDGKEVQWAGQLAGRLKALQKENGSWANDQDRWQEGDPCLVTSYCLVALQFCTEQLERKNPDK
jgi:squalene-hopene/tetraprenyl-beta-curcumene cyclase